MPVAGVDVGSVAAKAVVLDEEKKIVLGRAVLPIPKLLYIPPQIGYNRYNC